MKAVGGAKKRSLKQIERQQTLRSKKQQQEPRRRSDATASDRLRGGVGLPGVEDKDLVAELSKMKAITPYMVASRYDVRLSVAKNLLDSLQQRGVVQLTAGNNNLKLYQFTG